FLKGEYWTGPVLEPALLPTAIDHEDGSSTAYTPSGDELRDACQALRGSVLRQEVYSLDDSPKQANPYTVTESRYAVKLLQPRKHAGSLTPAMYMPTSLETVTLGLERASSFDDARIRHRVSLEVGYYGNTLSGVDIVYGRRSASQNDVDISTEDKVRQQQTFAVLSQTAYTNAVGTETNLIPTAHRLPVGYD